MKDINKLAKDIMHHRSLYYNGIPEISDGAFDAMIDTLKKYDPENPAVITIGAPTEINNWEDKKHNIPMGSLDKVNTIDEFIKWFENIDRGNDDIFLTEKLDGISIEVIYENGKIVSAITRGSGVEGQDILTNVIRMNGVFIQLPTEFSGSLRGEIILTKSNFNKHFKVDNYKNERNAASGISKRYDGIGCEYLDVLFYQAIGDVKFDTEFNQLEYIEQTLNLQTPYYCRISGTIKYKILEEKYKEYQTSLRDKLDYHIDGLVCRINDLPYQLSLGEKHMRPKGAIAFKFESEGGVSTITNIYWQTGSAGHITPVIEIEPVEIMGAMISRASIYNPSYIKDLGLDIGAEVFMSRRNDVIPAVETVLKSTGTIAEIPTHCPDCNEETKINGEHLICTNYNCPSQVIGRMINWIKKLDIMFWGEALIQKLYVEGMVEDIADLYAVEHSDIASLDNMGDKSAEKCIEELHSKTHIPLEVFLGSLSIPMTSIATIKLIMDSGYDILPKMMSMTIEDIAAIKGMGNIKAENFYYGLRNKEELIYNLLEYITIKERKSIMDKKLEGMSFALTGTLSKPRKEIAAIIEENGGVVKNTVGKGLNFLITDDTTSGTKKNENAKKFGTKIINEEEFLGMII